MSGFLHLRVTSACIMPIILFLEREPIIMKYRLIALLACSMLLASCGESSSSASSGASTDNTSTENTSVVDSSAYEGSSHEGEASTTAEGTSSAEATSIATDWTDEEKEAISSILGVDLPSFGISDYTFEYSAEEEYFDAYGIASVVDLEDYEAALVPLGFQVTLYEENYALEGYIYDEDYSYAYLSIELEEGDDVTTVDIYGAFFRSSAEWPADEILAYAEYTGLVNGIPAYEGATAYVHYIGSYFGLIYYSAIECYGAPETAEEDYGKVLTDAGFVYDDYLESYESATASVSAFYDSGVLYISAFGYEEEESISEPGEDWGEIWTDPEPGSGVFNFKDESQITTKGTEKSVWTAGEATFTVEKGSSNQDVGNPSADKSFYANPLRLYKGQVVTVASEKKIASIDFYCLEDGKSTVFNLTDLEEPEDGYWDIDWDKECVTLSFEEPVTSTSFELEYGQVRLQYAVVTFAAE